MNLDTAGIRLRPAQERILEYQGGRLGISAVPGSGKTLTLSLLAVRLIERLAREGRLDRQKVLVVTFSNAAVHNFRARINQLMAESATPVPGTGYTVCTLHALALEILRTRPSLVNLGEDFTVLDDRAAERQLRRAVQSVGFDDLYGYFRPKQAPNPKSLQTDACNWARSLIAEAKLHRMTAADFEERLQAAAGDWGLLRFGCRVYQAYTGFLWQLQALDYNDLMHLATEIVDRDENLRSRLQRDWPYILEDEAQDSSPLQEELLQRLTQVERNWVRVGDPNQAINTTFTGASHRLLTRFLRTRGTEHLTLPQSGRCALPILRCANALIEWSQRRFGEELEVEPLAEPRIEPTGPEDPQPNPAPARLPVVMVSRRQALNNSISTVVNSVRQWMRERPSADETVAVLVPDNHRGMKLVARLTAEGVPVDDTLMRTSSHTVQQARKVLEVLDFMVHPTMARAERVWARVWRLQRCGHLERAPREEDAPDPMSVALTQASREAAGKLAHWMTRRPAVDLEGEELAAVEEFRRALDRWSRAVLLPIEEIILLIGRDLFTEPVDLALSYRLALHLRDFQRQQPRRSLQICCRELRELVDSNGRTLKMLGEGTGYRADPGQVTVTTMHSAKGLEWDRVYLMGLENFSFPTDLHADTFMGSRYYVRDSLDLEAEGRALVRHLAGDTMDEFVLGTATRRARCEYVAERIRLLYVAITRARRSLVMMYDTGRSQRRDRESEIRPAEAWDMLRRLEGVHLH